ncbi:MAG: 50S ribosomal protein L6 [Pirellulaceae bacterium]
MSRIGKKPISVPAGVKIRVEDAVVTVDGPKGKLQYTHRPEVQVNFDEAAGIIKVAVLSDERAARAYHGLTRSLLQNMVLGVVSGYEKRLEIVGVGYIASIQSGVLSLRVGYANEIHKKIPAELQVTCPDQTHVVIKGCDKQQVGEFAAEVRAIRKPEPYKGKGVRYEGEHVKIKPGKAAT